ncbi:uncharacterized protein DUF930 [Aminobacter aminovorans]|uniref:Domain of Uncharacterized Function (DUF930) n=1 Tax=Aminobacter aminovorans TaxID=83263 RepID=A0A380WL80_AMIAI|nr:DUF930 domain-containing protein [Aminobacter aminovorans]TCS29219.1 uncharacterized protein DUF930 [Aminobacter aminovorans]SUU89072.1 Domain of Uncharacterised Function (DUF930) [Aminobacter aminovorans]
MADETSNRRRDLLWAWPTSLILHGLLVAVLVAYSQPRLPEQQEETVNVTLVPPPERPKPQPAPQPPAKAAEPEKPAAPKQQPVPASQPPRPAQIEVLKPVFRFGDKDAGSGKSPEEGSVQNAAPSSTKDAEATPPAEKPDAAKDAATQAAAAKDAEPAQDAENEAASNQDTGKQEADKQEGLADGADKPAITAPAPLGAAVNDGEIALPAMAKAPEPRPANASKPSLARIPKSASGSARAPNSRNAGVASSQPFSGLPGVRNPRSQGATGDALTMTSMAGVPRDKRAANLCASALQKKLVDASYSPDLVPLIPLKRGNVLDVPEAAFRTRTAWHALSFRCEVDTEATEIRSLSFRVGAKIPPEEWARLGLPANN